MSHNQVRNLQENIEGRGGELSQNSAPTQNKGKKAKLHPFFTPFLRPVLHMKKNPTLLGINYLITLTFINETFLNYTLVFFVCSLTSIQLCGMCKLFTFFQ